MTIITTEHAGQLRAAACLKHGAQWLHHYHEAIEAAVLEHTQAELEQLREALRRIHDLAHAKSTGPAVPDTLWEIRSIAQEVL